MTDTEKREKVIRGLEICTNPGSCSERCPYYYIEITEGSCDYFLLTDALSLLKEQEARVMTPKEFDEVRLSKPVWLEVRNMNLLEPALYRYSRPECGRVAFSLTENRAIERDVTEYYWGWRCWTSRPTPEQMRDTPWEGESDA
jgi:hypothetical protein